ncbi:MAG: acyltransferase, partial [Candidatus Bathyarchaeia archaeon]
QFWGGSRLIGPQGKLMACAKYDEEDLIISAVDYADIKPIETFVPTLKDLRPELFDELKKHAENL